MSNKPAWFLYIVRGSDKSLYTGITTDVSRRFSEHVGPRQGGNSKGAKALRGKRPLVLEYSCEIGNRSEASKIEYQVKKLSKSEKEELIAGGISLHCSLLTKASFDD